VETAVRAAMHHAGSAALTELLQFAAPAYRDQRGQDQSSRFTLSVWT
jgi:hypothetical protein